MAALTRSSSDDNFGNQKLNIAKQYLDEHCPLDSGSHSDVANYVVYYNHLLAFFVDGSHCGLKYPKQFVALSGHKDDPTAVLLKKADGLHVEINFDRSGENGKIDVAHIDDIQVETPLSATKNNNTALQRLWMSFLTGVQHAMCEQASKKQFTAKDGSDYELYTY